MKYNVEDMMLCYRVEQIFEWREWAHKIPPLQFPKGWQVIIIPPFAGAIARFMVTTQKLSDNNIRNVSVYLDAYSALGYWHDDEPYWEVYPDGDDTFRCAMSDTASLMKSIKRSIKELEKLVK